MRPSLPGPTRSAATPPGCWWGTTRSAASARCAAAFRPATSARCITVPLGDDVALLMSVSAFRGGGRGLQTQVWQRIDGRWLITAAHVTPRTPALDRTIWRSVGDPFLQGAWEGPLEGLTVAVKDLFAIAGFRIGAGNPTYLEQARPEKATAPAVADLLRGGASLRGIARTDEFAYSIAGDNAHYGTPPNGAVVGALPGGSSSGPASAVALGHADIGLATDTAGSIRVPASYQGLWGLRTTHDLVPRQGMLPLAQSFDTIGWLTRDGETLERVGRLVPQLRRLGLDRERLRRIGRRPPLAFPRARGDPRLRRRPRPARPSRSCWPPWRHPTIRRPSGRCTRATWMPPSPRSARCRAPRRGATTGSGCARTPGPWAPPSRSASASPRGSPPSGARRSRRARTDRRRPRRARRRRRADLPHGAGARAAAHRRCRRRPRGDPAHDGSRRDRRAPRRVGAAAERRGGAGRRLPRVARGHRPRPRPPRPSSGPPSPPSRPTPRSPDVPPPRPIDPPPAPAHGPRTHLAYPSVLRAMGRRSWGSTTRS